VRQVAHPLKFSQATLEIRRLAPSLREHTEEILESLGYTREKIKDLRREGVIA
jgi:crotonobetainyl-CoA:carnitine CoA-transferase CaiB-like acyl-CoA transferase